MDGSVSDCARTVEAECAGSLGFANALRCAVASALEPGFTSPPVPEPYAG